MEEAGFTRAVFKEIVARTFSLTKVGNGLSLASLQVSRLAVGVILNLIIASYPFLFIFLLQVTPTANRNSYRVARLVGVHTQGSVLRPQPWAGESQLLQSCRCFRGFRHKGYNVRVHGCRSCRCLRGVRHEGYVVCVHGCRMYFDAGLNQFQ